MKFRVLGRSGIEVSEICLGTMMFGGATDEKEADAIIAHGVEHGVNFIDTADVYNEGASEEIIGRILRGSQSVARDQIVIATKVGFDAAGKAKTGRDGNLSRRYVMASVDASLKRLQMDHIDLYYCHRTDPLTPWEEIVATFGDLIRAGKIRTWGLSNVRSWHIPHIVHLCREMSVPQPTALQPYYNALNRAPENELLPAAHFFGLGVVPYSPIARGVLTGKYMPGATPPEGSRVARKDARILQSEWRPESLEIAQKLNAHAQTRGASLVDFAVAWVLANRCITSAIAGPRTLAQWKSYFSALDYAWSEADESLVNSLVPAGHPSTPGYSDPAYPIEGRMV